MPIEGGYFLTARRMYADESWLMGKPPLFAKLWGWMMSKAKWQPGCGGVERGQFLTSIPKMQEAMAHYVGYRKVTPSKDQIRKSYEAFNERGMTSTTKTTRGILVTILKYEFYQNPKNYEGHDECPYEGRTKAEHIPHDSKEGKEVRKNKKTPPTPPAGGSGYTQAFEKFWEAYPVKRHKKRAWAAWKRIKGVNAPTIIEALRDQIEATHWRGQDGKDYIPHPATWLNGAGWEDEIKTSRQEDELPPELR